MSSDCKCVNWSKRCHDCKVSESHRLYTDKPLPVTPGGVFTLAGLSALPFAFIIGPIFFPVLFVSFAIAYCGWCNVQNDDYEEEYRQVVAYNKQQEQARQDYVNKDDGSCILL